MVIYTIVLIQLLILPLTHSFTDEFLKNLNTENDVQSDASDSGNGTVANDPYYNLVRAKGGFGDTLCLLPNIEPYQKRLINYGVKIFQPIIIVPGLGGSQLQSIVDIKNPDNPLCEEYTLNWGELQLTKFTKLL